MWTDKETNEKQFKKLDSFDMDLIIRKIKDIIDRIEVITIKQLRISLLQDICKTTLWKVMRARGFCFKKTNDINRKPLCERGDLQIARCAHLRKKYMTSEVISTLFTWMRPTWRQIRDILKKGYVQIRLLARYQLAVDSVLYFSMLLMNNVDFCPTANYCLSHIPRTEETTIRRWTLLSLNTG